MSSQYPKKFTKLRKDYCESLPEKVVQINDVWAKLKHQNFQRNWLVQLQHQVHQLAGSGGAFGFDEVSQFARDVDLHLEEHLSNEALHKVDIPLLDSLIEQLHHVIGNALMKVSEEMDTGNITDTGNPQNSQQLIYVVDDDELVNSLTSLQLTEKNYRVKSFIRAEDGINAIATERPDLILMDICFPEGSLAGVEAVENIHLEANGKIPVIFMSSRQDIVARIRALRAGGAAYLTKPFQYDDLFSTIEGILNQSQKVRTRVLIIDDDQPVAERYQLLLDEAGYQARIDTNPLFSLKTISDYRPDLVIIDMHMPKVNGIELLQLIRQSPEYSTLPVMFLTSDDTELLREQAILSGTNAFVRKSVDDLELINVIESTLRNNLSVVKLYNRLTQRSASGGLVNRAYFIDCLESALCVEDTSELCQALYFVSIDQLEKVHYSLSYPDVISLQDQLVKCLQGFIGTRYSWAAMGDFAFAMLIEGKTVEYHEEYAQRIITHIANHSFVVNEEALECTASVGLLPLDESVFSCKVAFLYAEKAQQEAYLAGGNSVSIYHATDNRKYGMLIGDTLPVDQLKLVYQPIIDIEGSSTSIFDSLVRLETEDGNMVSPIKFLPYLEQKGLTRELDRWVVSQAIESVASRIGDNVDSSICIHVSEGVISDKDFLEYIDRELVKNPTVAVENLIFHIEERYLGLYPHKAMDFCQLLHDRGAKLLLNNFSMGSNGNEALDSHLFTFLQLSPELTTGIVDDQGKKSALRQLVKKVSVLDCQVIAGQIEDPSALTLLWTLGIRLFKGYFIQGEISVMDYDARVNPFR